MCRIEIGLCGLELADLGRVVLVGRRPVSGGDRRLVDLRVEAERLRRLRARRRRARIARRASVSASRSAKPTPAIGGRREGLGLEDLGELGLDPDRGELARVAANLVDADRRDHLLDPLAERGADVGDVLGVVVDADDLEHRVRVDAVGAEAEREDDVVDVADRRRAQHDRAPATQVRLAGLDLERLQRLVDRRRGQVRVEVTALAVVDGAVGEHDAARRRRGRASPPPA